MGEPFVRDTRSAQSPIERDLRSAPRSAVACRQGLDGKNILLLDTALFGHQSSVLPSTT